MSRSSRQHLFTAGCRIADGRYEVVREINRGGAAVVYEARDLHRQPPDEASAQVALKCHDLRSADPRALDRLKREITNAKDAATSAATHPPSPHLFGAAAGATAAGGGGGASDDNVVRLLNVVLEGDCLVLVIELVRGCDLLEVINRAGGCLNEPLAHHYFVQILNGVRQLHERNLCHRDLKPENCMVEASTSMRKRARTYTRTHTRTHARFPSLPFPSFALC